MARVQQSRVGAILRRLGFCLVATGVALLASVFAIAEEWSTIHFAAGVDIPVAVPGAALIVMGFFLAWLNRQPSSHGSVERIDVRPIAEWVRAFERHQADVEFHRLSELNHGRALVKRQATKSHQQPAA